MHRLEDMPGSELFIHNGDSAPYWWLDGLWIFLAEAKDTGGRFSMMGELLRKDAGCKTAQTRNSALMAAWLVVIE